MKNSIHSPDIDLGECSVCEGCIEVCPEVFRKNSVSDYIEIIDLEQYPAECVNEAIKICPCSCISWTH